MTSPTLRSLPGGMARRPPGEHAGGVPPVFVLAGGRGGVGTSTAAALAALEGAGEGRRVLLVDLDDGASSLPLLLGVTLAADGGGGGHGEDPARFSPEERVLPVTSTLSFLPLGVPAGKDGGAGALRRVRARRAARLYRAFDLVVVDAGNRLASVRAALELGGERLVVVASADRIALAASHALFKAVGRLNPRLPLELLANRADPIAGTEVHALASSAARTFLGRAVALAGVIPVDGRVESTPGSSPLPFLPRDTPARAAMAPVVSRWLTPVR